MKMIRMMTVSHHSILCITKAANDCHDNYHRSILCITNAAKSEIMMIIRTMMIRMTTVMISIITAPSALPMVPKCIEERDDDDNHDDDGESNDCDDNHHEDDKDDDYHGKSPSVAMRLMMMMRVMMPAQQLTNLGVL